MGDRRTISKADEIAAVAAAYRDHIGKLFTVLVEAPTGDGRALQRFKAGLARARAALSDAAAIIDGD